MPTCRDEILEALPAVLGRSADGTFTVQSVVDELRLRKSRFAESTIRTHVTSRMCSNAPDNHGTVYRDLERVGHGRYIIRNHGAS